MTRPELEKKIKELRIPENSYSLEGKLIDGLVLDHRYYSTWTVFNYDLSRGTIFEEKKFDNEEDACDYIYSLLLSYSNLLRRLGK